MVCWNRKLSHRFVWLLHLQFRFVWEFYWITAIINYFRVSLRDQALWCSVRDGLESVLPCSLRIDTAVWVHTCRTGPVFWGQRMAKENFALPIGRTIEDLLQLTLKSLNWGGDVLARQVWSTCSTDTLVRLELCGREWSFVLWFGRFRGKKTGKNHLCPLIVCIVHLTRSAFNRSSYNNVDKMNVL